MGSIQPVKSRAKQSEESIPAADWPGISCQSPSRERRCLCGYQWRWETSKIWGQRK
jgi:hypothetical protein